jgi:hypothetical protein
LIAGLQPPPLALAGGAWIFLGFVVVFLFAVIFGYYTIKGSGISKTPFRREGGPPESPSEVAHDITQDPRNWERGTAGHHRRHRPLATQIPVDPQVAEALRQWRDSAAGQPRLRPPIGGTDHVRGMAAKRSVAIYFDLTSEPCRAAYQLVAHLADQGLACVAVRHLPLADVHKLSLPGAEILEAAGAQGRFFELLDELVVTGVTEEAELLDRASAFVADPDRLRLELATARHRPRVIENIRWATASGAHTIPEIYIDEVHYRDELTRPALLRALGAKSGRSDSGGV